MLVFNFRKISLAVLALATLGIPSLSRADDIGLSARNFGQLLLVPDQSTGGHKALIAAQEGGAFEPLSEFNPEDRYRKFGAAIARLDTLTLNQDGKELYGVCTANLIARDVLLTNYHCIPGMNPGETVIRSIAVFDFLREDQEDAPIFEVDVTPIAADINLDFALLRVAGNPGDQFGYFDLQPRKAQPNQSLFLIHHPAGMPKRLTRFRCKAYAPQPYARTNFRHRCDTLGGSSGSLIFNLDFEVVALHNKGGLNDSSTTSFNRGISIFSLMQNEDFASYVNPTVAAPAPQAPTSKQVVLRPMADLLADQAKAKADAQAKVEKPLGLPKGFSLYDPNSYASGKLPKRFSHGPLPLAANALCDKTTEGRICASSYLDPEGSGKYTYNMANLAQDDGLAWVEGVRGFGLGEWLVFDFAQEKLVANIVFRNGYTRSNKTYASNSRVSEVTIELSTGSSFRVQLADNNKLQQYTLPAPQFVNWVKITVSNAFKGQKYSDTALSYVDFR